MPWAAPRVCSAPGCNVPTRSDRCAQHPRRDDRPSSSVRGYGSRDWRSRRAAVLRRDPICCECNAAPSTTAAHIVARSAGGDDSLFNLRGLCTSCHSRETSARDRGFGNPRGR